MEEKSCLNSQWIEGFATTHQQSKWDLLFCILNFLSLHKRSQWQRGLFWSSKQQGWKHHDEEICLWNKVWKKEKGTVNRCWSWSPLILKSRSQQALNSTYLCAQQTLGTSTGRKAGLPASGAGSPHCSGISSGHSYTTWPESNWLCSPGQSASGGSSAHHDTARDTLGWWNELLCGLVGESWTCCCQVFKLHLRKQLMLLNSV